MAMIADCVVLSQVGNTYSVAWNAASSPAIDSKIAQCIIQMIGSKADENKADGPPRLAMHVVRGNSVSAAKWSPDGGIEAGEEADAHAFVGLCFRELDDCKNDPDARITLWRICDEGNNRFTVLGFNRPKLATLLMLTKDREPVVADA